MHLLPKVKRVASVFVFISPIIIIAFLFFFLSILFGQNSNKVAAAEIPSDHYVSASGKELSLHGKPYQFTGVNAFNLATYPGVNAGCGGYVTDLDNFFASLKPNSMVRLWAFQGTIATNAKTKKIDWTGLDRVVNAAQKNGKKLVLVLGEQVGHCDDGHFKDKAWYQGGYRQAYNDYGNGLTPLPYLDYVKLVVARYKDSPAVALWEPINEPEASDCLAGIGYECYANLKCSSEEDAAAALRSFYDTVGGAIKSIDSNHLISSGTIGDGQCGTIYEDYKYVHASSGIDIGSFHDYQHNDEPIPGDEWNGLGKRIEQMDALNKPLIVGEAGMLAVSGGEGCLSLTERKDKMKAKLDAQFAAGVDGFMPWSLTLSESNGCNYDIVANDPLITLLRDYPAKMSGDVIVDAITLFATPTPTPVDTVSPSIPTGLVTTNVSSNQISLKWNASSDNVKVARYDIFRNYSYVTSTTGTSFTNSNLTPGTTYMYYVKAKDSSGNYSPMSTKLTVKTAYTGTAPTPTNLPTPTPTKAPDTVAPAAPTGLTATSPSPGQVVLKWNQATDNVKVARYEIYRDYSYVTATTTTSFTNYNVVSGKTYLYYLKSRDAAGNSSGSSTKVKVTVK